MTRPDAPKAPDLPHDEPGRPDARQNDARRATARQNETRRRRILFRATHRGTYENDLLIGSFVRARLDRFTEAELDAIETVMDHPDATLADWLTGRLPVPADADTPMLRAMIEAASNGEARTL